MFSEYLILLPCNTLIYFYIFSSAQNHHAKSKKTSSNGKLFRLTFRTARPVNFVEKFSFLSINNHIIKVNCGQNKENVSTNFCVN